MVQGYYRCLHTILEARKQKDIHLAECAECGVLFLTDRRNRGRTDLRCPFGCREAHQRRSSAARVQAYYGTERGKYKKRLLNARARGPRPAPCVSEVPEVPEAVVAYLCLILGRLEGRPVARDEILALAEGFFRQQGWGIRQLPAYYSPGTPPRGP